MSKISFKILVLPLCLGATLYCQPARELETQGDSESPSPTPGSPPGPTTPMPPYPQAPPMRLGGLGSPNDVSSLSPPQGELGPFSGPWGQGGWEGHAVKAGVAVCTVTLAAFVGTHGWLFLNEIKK